MPKTKDGLWPAFWLLGDNFSTVGWPQCGEIDIMEMGSKAGIDGNTQEQFLTRATHWGEVQNGAHPNYAINGNYSSSLQDDFHLYTMTWDKRYIRMYLDLDKNPAASPYYEILIDANEGQYPIKNYFNRPFFIIFNVAVGGNFPQIHTVDGISALNKGNNYEASMYVDYVKVYDDGNELIWQDLFDSGTLDESTWNVEENDDGGGNNELQSYRRQNVSITTEPGTGKHCLTLTAKR